MKLPKEKSDNDFYLNIDRKYKVDRESKKVGFPTLSCDVQCYTDGSKIQNKVGYGYCITKDDEEIVQNCGYLGECATVFQAEVCGIKMACDQLIKMKEPDSVTIFTDSQASLDSLRQVRVRSNVVVSCIKSLNHLAETKSVYLKWIKSHNNYTGNEAADALAKKGALHGQKIGISIPVGGIKSSIKTALFNEWNMGWKTHTECRQTKIWFPSAHPNISKKLMNLTRYDLSLMIHLFTGHNGLNRHESLLNPQVDPTCRLCLEEEESAWHLIGQCPALWRQRMDIFHTHYMEAPEGSLQQLLKMTKRDNKIRGMMDTLYS